MARKSNSKPVSTPTPTSDKPRCFEDKAPKASQLAFNSEGESLWEVYSLNPYVDASSRTKPPILVTDITFDEAVSAMRAAGAERGPCPLVMWPAWAFYPEDWCMDNDVMFQEIQLYYQQRQIERLQAELKAVRAVSPKTKSLSTVSGRVMPKGIA